MSKYIDAEKLLAEIESRMEDCKLPDGKFPTTTNIVRYEELFCLRNYITSLQQEQPKFKVGDTIHKKGENTVFPMTIERISDGDYVCVTEHQQSFINIKFQDDYELVEHEQPEVDIDEEIDKFIFAPFQNFDRVSGHCLVDMGDGKEWVPVYDWKITTYKRADAHFLRKFARHFYKLGLNARKEK